VELIGEIEPRHPLMATALNNLGLVEVTAGNVRRARQLFERALAIWHQTVGADHPDYASGLTNLASVEHGQKKRQLCAEALRIDQARLGALHPRVEADLNNAAMAALAVRDYPAAEAYFRLSLDVHMRRGAPETVEEGLVMANLAGVYMRQESPGEAEDMYRHAIAVLRRTAGPEDPRLGGVLETWARVLRQSGMYAEAEDAEVKATGIRVSNALRGNP
jgi:tetratricopeptide (TPR) repeat protein